MKFIISSFILAFIFTSCSSSKSEREISIEYTKSITEPLWVFSKENTIKLNQELGAMKLKDSYWDDYVDMDLKITKGGWTMSFDGTDSKSNFSSIKEEIDKVTVVESAGRKLAFELTITENGVLHSSCMKHPEASMAYTRKE